MKQSYRHNAREEVFRARYRTAKRPLQELARHPIISFSGDSNECEDDIRAKVQSDIDSKLSFTEQRQAEIDAYKAECEALPIRAQAIEDTLTDLGFEKETLDDYLVYVRRTGKDMEILTDCALHRQKMRREVCLYHVPEQDINEWYTDLPVRTEQARKKVDRWVLGMPCYIIFGVGLAIMATMLPEPYTFPVFILSLGGASVGVIQSAVGAERADKQKPENTDLIASGYENGVHNALLETIKLSEETIIDSLKARVEEYDHKEPAEYEVSAEGQALPLTKRVEFS